MKTKTASLLIAATFGVLTTSANAFWGGRPPIPVPAGGICPPTYHQEQVTRNGMSFNGSIGGSYGPFNGSVGFQSPQYTQQYMHCFPNERRGMGTYPMPAPMPRPQGFTPGPMGPMMNSTPMWMMPRR